MPVGNIILQPIVWFGDSKEVVRSWSEKTRRRAGEELFRLQIGSDPLHWRGMKSIGAGVREIKISEGGEHRIVYLMSRSDRILVLHAFQKKTRRTAKADMELSKQRLRAAK